jgi:hypothetical protein
MKAFGEGARRRGQLISSEETIDGVKHVKVQDQSCSTSIILITFIQVQYHVSGPNSQGDVFAEAKPKGWLGDLDFNYIIVNVPRRQSSRCWYIPGRAYFID